MASHADGVQFIFEQHGSSGVRQLGNFFALGYLSQGVSFILLLLSAVALPNFLGLEKYAEFTKAVALLMLPACLLTESVSYKITSDLVDNSGKHEKIYSDIVSLVIQSVSIGFFFLLVVAYIFIDVSTAISEVLAASAALLIFCIYVAIIAWLRANLRARAVLVLTVANGMAMFTVPVGLSWADASMSYAPLIIYVISLSLASLYINVPNYSTLRNLRLSFKQLFDWHHLLFTVPSVYRNLVMWLPILWLSSAEKAEDVALYRLSLAVILGAASLVPFPRETMFNISLRVKEKKESLGLFELKMSALMIAGFGSVLLFMVREYLVAVIYTDAFLPLADYLSVMCIAIVCHTAFDIIVLDQFLYNDRKGIIFGLIGAVLGAGVMVNLAGIAVIPPAAAIGYIVAASWGHKKNEVITNKTILMFILIVLVSIVVPLKWGRVFIFGEYLSGIIFLLSIMMSMTFRKTALYIFRKMLYLITHRDFKL